MWFIWNKTTFGKNMFAVGSNPEAANVSGVNVMKTTIMVHTLAGMMYGITGFIESARIGSNTANTGLNYGYGCILTANYLRRTELFIHQRQLTVHHQRSDHSGCMCY